MKLLRCLVEAYLDSVFLICFCLLFGPTPKTGVIGALVAVILLHAFESWREPGPRQRRPR